MELQRLHLWPGAFAEGYLHEAPSEHCGMVNGG
eukprot:CAMPEP_0174885530 /NCGR_PEP_ID=MMETSP0167-20121228/786_1 /TAXON_ID=38298 /ORGANISM="Rhodella maculata, Strain CCMP736" /LENGTH=32 /DNA_ID= /DNA_START= /DNA_END= /DNA_ORIENTATION=